MSSPAQSGPSGPSAPKTEREKRGFGKVLSRVKTVLKGDSSSKRQSTIAAGRTAKPSGAETTKSEAPKPKPSPAAERRAQFERTEGVAKVSKSQLLEERAKKLNERFGLEIDTSPWNVLQAEDDSVFRTDKPIRMRIRRTCHNCNTDFTTLKECPNCKHVRCTKCTRYPPKRSEAEIIASRERRAALIKANKERQPIQVDYSWQFNKKPVVLKKPSKTGGQDLIHKKPRQRVKRTCHECNTTFVKTSKKCENCSHARCTDCPRDPAKKDKYPLGYPGDEFGPSSVPHYECKKCQTIYPTGSDHGIGCKKCGLEKSDESPRAMPRKVEIEPDAEVLRTIQEKIAALKVT